MPRARKQLSVADREKAKKGIRARQEAIKTLIERHKTEFDEVHVKYRLMAGLAPTNGGLTRAQLEAKIRKGEEKLAKDRELLQSLPSDQIEDDPDQMEDDQ
jgi:hypothetical protein